MRQRQWPRRRARRGRIKRVNLEEFASVRPSGLIAMSLEEGDKLGWARLTSGKDEIIIVTENGQALRFSETKYRTLVEQIPAITYTISLAAGIDFLYVSPQVEPLLGFSPEAWRSDAENWERQIHPDDRERLLAEITQSLETGEPFSTEYRLLAFLMTHPDRVYSRGQLLDRVWGGDVYVEERTIDVHIRRIREKLGTDHIRTIKGVGYKYVAE